MVCLDNKVLTMTTRNELEAFYAVVDSLTPENQVLIAKVLVAVLKGKGNETDTGNLAQNPVLVDILLQHMDITKAGEKGSVSCWFSPNALRRLEILAQS